MPVTAIVAVLAWAPWVLPNVIGKITCDSNICNIYLGSLGSKTKQPYLLLYYPRRQGK
jgi:hypothetical protein